MLYYGSGKRLSEGGLVLLTRHHQLRLHTAGLAGGLLVLGLGLTFLAGDASIYLFLPFLFSTLACVALLGSICILTPKGIYVGFHCFLWLLGLAISFLVSFWPCILLVIGASLILFIAKRPILSTLESIDLLRGTQRAQPQPKDVYAWYETPPLELPPH
jgi:hypothetical protein